MKDERQLLEIWHALPFTRLFESFRMAVGPTKMIIAVLTVITVCFVGWLMDVCTETRPSGGPEQAILTPIIMSVVDFGKAAELEVYVTEPERTIRSIEQYKQQGAGRGVFSTLWNFGAARFNGATVSLLKLDIANVLANIWLCAVGLGWAIKYHTVYSIVYFIIVTIVICVFGGAICRCAALEFARSEKPGLTEAFRFSGAKLSSLLAAPFVLVSIILLLAALVFFLGLMGNLPGGFGELITALGFGAALLIGLLLVFLSTGTIAGAGLMLPAVAYEGSDGLDAISRSFMYVFRRPWTMLLYTLTATVWGTVSYLFARLFVFLVLIVTYVLLYLGFSCRVAGAEKLASIWPRPEFLNLIGTSAEVSMNWSQSIASFLIHLTVLFIVGIVVAFVISFYFSASTIIYALMRDSVDKVPIDEIYVQLDELRDEATASSERKKD
ncbi:MAG: hypothetical protein DRP65_01615 [Planctomycetota bacterium]|nr:MAG: hypothetical protein DRP65_01615 [Planctomycetota bacterium]